MAVILRFEGLKNSGCDREFDRGTVSDGSGEMAVTGSMMRKQFRIVAGSGLVTFCMYNKSSYNH